MGFDFIKYTSTSFIGAGRISSSFAVSWLPSCDPAGDRVQAAPVKVRITNNADMQINLIMDISIPVLIQLLK
jgi:hypothetical protein